MYCSLLVNALLALRNSTLFESFMSNFYFWLCWIHSLKRTDSFAETGHDRRCMFVQETLSLEQNIRSLLFVK